MAVGLGTAGLTEAQAQSCASPAYTRLECEGFPLPPPPPRPTPATQYGYWCYSRSFRETAA